MPTMILIGVLVILLIAAIALLIGNSLTDIVGLASDTRKTHLPQVVERQRTAVNVERLGRFGEIILTTDDSRRRRNTRLEAQILAQDSAFENDPHIHGMVWEIFQVIRDIARIRDNQDLDKRRIEGLLEQADMLIEGLILPQDNGTTPDRVLDIALTLHALHTARDLAIKAEGAGSSETLRDLQSQYQLQQRGVIQLTRQLVLPGRVKFLSELPDRLEELGMVFRLRADVLEKEQKCQLLWQDARWALEELTNRLSVGAASRASDRMMEIEAAAHRVTATGYIGITSLTMVLLVLFFFFRRDIVTPIMQATRGLERIRAGKIPEIPPARLYELEAISGAVERLSLALAQIRTTNEKLHMLSMQDGLTGISNRRYFDEAYVQEWSRAMRHQRPLSMLMIDIDQFKQYNDTYGHQKGDDCLKQVARTIGSSSGRAGDIAARYGGEEFVVVLPETELSGAISIAEKIKKAVADLGIEHRGSTVEPWLTVSIGAASIIPTENVDREKLLNMADKALLRAKQEGRNRICASD